MSRRAHGGLLVVGVGNPLRGDDGVGLLLTQRLRETLRKQLHGERILILANREPYVHNRLPDGSVQVVHPASGLVTALEPVMRACSGVWIAHGSGTADRDTVDAQAHVRVPPGEESYVVRRVWLTPDDVKANLPKVEKLNALAQQRGQSLAQMAIAWVLRKPAVTSALIGASSVTQLENSLAALNNLKFSDDELNQIEAILHS